MLCGHCIPPSTTDSCGRDSRGQVPPEPRFAGSCGAPSHAHSVVHRLRREPRPRASSPKHSVNAISIRPAFH